MTEVITPIYLRTSSVRKLLVLLASLLSMHVRAQSAQVASAEGHRQDSLRHLLQIETRADTIRVNRLNKLALALRTNDTPQAMALFRAALGLAQRLGHQTGKGNAQFGLGYCYRATNSYDSALYCTQQALQIYSGLHDHFNQVRSLYNLARIYHEQGDYSQALEMSLRGLPLAQAHNNRKGELFLNVQLGLTNTALGQYTAAQRYLGQALTRAQLLPDAVGIGHAYSGLGDLSRQRMRWAQARYYYKQAAASYRKVYNASGMLPTELSLAEMLECEGYHELALATAIGLLARARVAGNRGQTVRSKLLLATVFLATNQLDSARCYGASSLAATQHSGLRQQAYDAASVLAQASVRQKRWRDAYRYQQLMSTYADSLTGEATRRRVAILEQTYARSQQQSQIRLLTQRARLQAQQQELDRLRYHQQVAALTMLAMLLLLLGGYLLWQRRQRERQRLDALRTRIAADLHDEVGSMLTQISMQSNLLREGQHAPAQQQAYLDQMAEASRRAARQMSDAVWSIDARYDSVASLLDRLRAHAHEALPAAGVALDFWAAPALTTMTMPLPTRQALYFIYKEALHNVVKHAQAQQVRVRLRLLDRQLELAVQDDGQGLRSPGRESGEGLRNMRMRALGVGGEIALDGAAPGTGLVARLPLQ